MRLLRLQVCRLGPFRQVVFCFGTQAGASEGGGDNSGAVTVVHGPGGVGKTTLLSAIAATRPGCIQSLSQRLNRNVAGETSSEPPYAIADWALSRDDPQRPHPLRLASPGARVFADDQEESLRRREQVLFDRVAREGGFTLLALPATRWFSRQPLAVSSLARSPGGYDVRASQVFDDGTRSDLTRDTKQALAYAAIARALNRERGEASGALSLLGDAMHQVVDELVQLVGFAYWGLDPVSFEPQFRSALGSTRPFDDLPTQARHLACFGALALRALWTSPMGRDPREREAVVLIDEIELHQDAQTRARLVSALRRVLPGVQWILTTTSSAVAGSVEVEEVLALRRMPESEGVEVFVGSDARTH